MSYVGKHRDAKPKKKRRVLRAIAISTAVVLLALATGGFMFYRHLEGNITSFDMDGQLTDRPTEVDSGPKKPLNILLLGSDTRVGQTAVLGSTPGLSDTTILLHLSADRKRAYGISVPRDLMVERPTCKRKDGSGTVSAGLDMWNAAYAYGGPVCTVAQFEAMTHIRVNHTIVVDFNGFKSMVNALGGVEICVPKEVDDDIGQIHLPAGSYKVNGTQALDYVRVRHEISQNGDIGRMKRQQVFLAAMVNKAISAGTLLNPPRLLRFLNAATKSVTTDEGLSKLKELYDLAMQFKDIGLSKIQFLTMPITSYAPDPNRLAAGEGAAALWNTIRLDKPLTKAQRTGVTKASDNTPTGSPSATPSATPASNEKAEEAAANGLCA